MKNKIRRIINEDDTANVRVKIQENKLENITGLYSGAVKSLELKNNIIPLNVVTLETVPKTRKLKVDRFRNSRKKAWRI